MEPRIFSPWFRLHCAAIIKYQLEWNYSAECCPPSADEHERKITHTFFRPQWGLSGMGEEFGAPGDQHHRKAVLELLNTRSGWCVALATTPAAATACSALCHLVSNAEVSAAVQPEYESALSYIHLPHNGINISNISIINAVLGKRVFLFPPRDGDINRYRAMTPTCQ